jgi:outer membrane protein with beta-barrel domain
VITLPLVALMLLSDPLATAGRNELSTGYPNSVVNDGPPNSSFRYDYIEGALLLGDFDGVRGGGSWHITGPWIGLGRIDYLTEDEGNTDVDLLLLSGGVGYVHTLENELDFIGSAEIEIGDAEIDGPGGNEDDDDIGLRFRAGARFQADEKIELAGGVSFSTIFDEDLGLDVQALYAFKENLAGFVGLDIRDDTVGVIGVRYYF